MTAMLRSSPLAPISLLVLVGALAGCSSSSAAGDAGPAGDGASEGLRFSDVGTGEGAVAPDTFNPDVDGDGLTNAQELALGTDPLLADTDNDGQDDGSEVGDVDSPTDGDGDGKIDALEPADFDSDNDGTPDQQDADDTDGPCGARPRLFFNETLTADTVLASACNPYKVLGQLVVAGGAKLAAGAGIELRFGPGAALVIGDNSSRGSLSLTGGLANAVTLTADSSQPTPGFWRGVVVENGLDIQLVRAALSWAGGPAPAADPPAQLLIKLLSGQLTLSQTKLAESPGYGIYARQFHKGKQLLAIFSGNVFEAVAVPLAINVEHLGEIGSSNDFGSQADTVIEVLGGSLGKKASWHFVGDNLRYRLLETTINIDAELTIEAGVQIELAAGAELAVAYSGNGSLRAQGTAAKPVRFASGTGTPGSWAGLIFAAGDNALQNARVVGAGKANTKGIESAIFLDADAKLSANAVTVKDSSGYGVYVERKLGGCGGAGVSAGYVFDGTITKCKLQCVDDTNTPGGTCLVP